MSRTVVSYIDDEQPVYLDECIHGTEFKLPEADYHDGFDTEHIDIPQQIESIYLKNYNWVFMNIPEDNSIKSITLLDTKAVAFTGTENVRGLHTFSYTGEEEEDEDVAEENIERFTMMVLRNMNTICHLVIPSYTFGGLVDFFEYRNKENKEASDYTASLFNLNKETSDMLSNRFYDFIRVKMIVH